MPIEVLMPALSPTMEEGTLSSWLVKPGDAVKSGDIIAEIETDKATMEVEAVDEGVLGKILVETGTEGVKVNSPIALLLEDGEDESALKGATPPQASPEGEGERQASKGEQASKSAASGANTERSSPASPSRSGEDRGGVATAPPPSEDHGDRIKASPLARRLAADAGLDLAALTGSGPHGRIVKRDV